MHAVEGVNIPSLRNPYTRSRGRTPRGSRAAPLSPPQWRNSPHKFCVRNISVKQKQIKLDLNDKKALKGVRGENKSFPPEVHNKS